jgi:hypothetical protein
VEYTSDNHAYPCPYCGKFIFDEKKHFRLSKVREKTLHYGNPFILSQMDYERFLTHRDKDEFRPYPLSVQDLRSDEIERFRRLCGTYPEAHEKFCLAWSRYNP